MTGSISPWPLVKNGANDHPVKTLQYLLRARGQSVVVDGAFGPNTTAAVQAFQSSHGLSADGVVGPITWAALVVQVKAGSQGDAVKGVQEEFQFRNQSGDPSKGPQVDGIFGPTTEAAVRGFQQALVARHSLRQGRRGRRPGDLAGAGQRHAVVLSAARDRPERRWLHRVCGRSWRRHGHGRTRPQEGLQRPRGRDLQEALKALGYDPGPVDGRLRRED